MFRLLYKRQKYSKLKAKIGGGELELLVADSFVKKAIGLMYRKSLGENEGMLFKFGREGYYGIWMRNMLFSIDIIWIGESGRIVDIVESAEPCTRALGCEVYKPREKGKYIIEARKGFAKKAKIAIGDKVSLP